jgi:alpha-D-ribose 1-methylphosphonate 5-triphosphate diphosphatase
VIFSVAVPFCFLREWIVCAGIRHGVRMTRAFVLKNAKIVTPVEVIEGSISLHAGLIDGINTGASSSPEGMDMGGDYLLPGLIDVHTDNLERHLLPRNNAS